MIRALGGVALLVIMAKVAWADNITTAADAFNAGKDFANAGKGVAGGTINSASGSTVLPYYSTTAPEAVNFQDGRNLISGAGSNKQTECQSYRAPTAFQQQECDAVNFMSKNPTQRPKFTIDKQNDPILTHSSGVINNPGAVPGATTQHCRVVKKIQPATYTTEVCNEFLTTETVNCTKNLTAKVNRAFAFTMGQTCMAIYGVGCSSGEQIAGIVSNFSAAWNLGYRDVMSNGTLQGTITKAFSQGAIAGRFSVSFSSRPGWYSACDSFTIGWESGSNSNYGRGTQISMCGTGQCTQLTPTVTSEGIVGYSCAGSSGGAGCPSGFIMQGDGVTCLDNSYATYSHDTNCSLVNTAPTVIPGTNSATEYTFACTAIDDTCAAYEARTQ